MKKEEGRIWVWKLLFDEEEVNDFIIFCGEGWVGVVRD